MIKQYQISIASSVILDGGQINVLLNMWKTEALFKPIKLTCLWIYTTDIRDFKTLSIGHRFHSK